MVILTILFKAKNILANGPLKRAKRVLIRNLIIKITKSFINDDNSYSEKKKHIVALQAIIEIHRKESEDIIKSNFPTLASGT